MTDGEVRSAINVLAFTVELAAAAIVGVAALQALVRAALMWRPSVPNDIEHTRLGLGRWLSLAIEFELAADIIRSGVSPSWSDLGKLATIVAIRSTINAFLQRDLSRENIGPSPR